MKKISRRSFLMAAGTAAAAAALSACGGSGSSTAASASGESSNSYTMFMRSAYVDWLKELKWYDVAEERTGIHVEYISGPEDMNDLYSEVDQRVISGDLPDAAMTRLAQTNVYGPQGVFADLAPYIPEYAPNLQAYMDANPDYKNLVTSADGAIYGLVKENPIFADLIGYRVDHFEKAGIDPAAVVTIDDFTNALRTLKEFYGKDNVNYYPLCGRESCIRFAAWFKCPSSISAEASHGIYQGHYKDGSVDIRADGAYTMIETMKLWYDEGLINPEWVAGTFAEADWEASMLNGNSSVFFDYYNRAEWFMENGGPDNDPDYQMGVLDYLKDENGVTMKNLTSTKYLDECVTAVNAKCSEEKIKTILTFIDYFYTEEGIELANYGVEGESFEVAEDGSKQFIVDYQTEEATPVGEKRWSFLSDRFTVCKPVDNEAFYKWNAPLIAEAATRIFIDENMNPSYTLKFTDEESRELSNLIASVFDSQMSTLCQFINGSRPFNQDEWNAYIAEMDALGLARIEEIQLAAFKATYGG